MSRFPRSDWLGSSTSPPLITRSNLSAGPIAAPAGVAKRPDSVAAAADPVSARKLRRENADMLALPQIDFYGRMMRRTPAFRKPPMNGARCIACPHPNARVGCSVPCGRRSATGTASRGAILPCINTCQPHPEEPPTGPREARPDDKLRGVSKNGLHIPSPIILRDERKGALLRMRPLNPTPAQSRDFTQRLFFGNAVIALLSASSSTSFSASRLAFWLSLRDAFGIAATPSWSSSHFSATWAALAPCLRPIAISVSSEAARPCASGQ